MDIMILLSLPSSCRSRQSYSDIGTSSCIYIMLISIANHIRKILVEVWLTLKIIGNIGQLTMQLVLGSDDVDTVTPRW
ncbi:hypothetical protein N9772_01525 [Bacteroidia bacterium]|nr:hypothetical protein [Bacteroidia bacterium]